MATKTNNKNMEKKNTSDLSKTVRTLIIVGGLLLLVPMIISLITLMYFAKEMMSTTISIETISESISHVIPY